MTDVPYKKHNNNNNIILWIASVVLVYVGLAQARPNDYPKLKPMGAKNFSKSLNVPLS